MSETRTPSKRLPISCEPCRVRKIRCSRDGTPCSTCTRRRVPHCRYLNAFGVDRPSSATLHQARSPAPSSSVDDASTLAQRVQRLEQLIQEQERRSSGLHSSVTEHYPELTNTQLVSPSASSVQSRRCGKNLSGFLRTTDSGHVRFIPNTHQWNHDPDDVAISSTSCPETPLPERQAAMRDLLSRLPPASQCSELVNVYFRSFASLFHILHDPTFARQYEVFLEDAESVSLSWLALLFAVLATAVLALDRDDPILQDLSRSRRVGKVTELMDRYRNAAMACLDADHYLWNHNVTTLQALVLIIYSTSHTRGGTWTMIGLAHHLAVSIGCHVDPSAIGLNTIESEERRRCWSGLMMLYTSENMAMGNNSLPHHLLPANSRPPTDVDDDQLDNEIQTTSSPMRATQMTYLLLKFRLHDICSDLCDRVLNAEGTPTYHVVMEIDTAIENERRPWDTRYLDNNVGALQPLPAHHQAHLYILQSYSNHLLLLLHHAALAADSNLSTPESTWSENRIVSSALHLLKTHDDFQQSPELVPFRWYNRGIGAFHAFHAATLLFGFRWSPSGRQRIHEIREAIQSCAGRFEAMKEAAANDLSLLCSKATPALRYLWYVICLSPTTFAHADHAKFPLDQ